MSHALRLSPCLRISISSSLTKLCPVVKLGLTSYSNLMSNQSPSLLNELGIIDIPLVFRFSPPPRRDLALLLSVSRSQPQPRAQLRLPPAPSSAQVPRPLPRPHPPHARPRRLWLTVPVTFLSGETVSVLAPLLSQDTRYLLLSHPVCDKLCLQHICIIPGAYKRLDNEMLTTYYDRDRSKSKSPKPMFYKSPSPQRSHWGGYFWYHQHS